MWYWTEKEWLENHQWFLFWPQQSTTAVWPEISNFRWGERQICWKHFASDSSMRDSRTHDSGKRDNWQQREANCGGMSVSEGNANEIGASLLKSDSEHVYSVVQCLVLISKAVLQQVLDALPLKLAPEASKGQPGHAALFPWKKKHWIEPRTSNRVPLFNPYRIIQSYFGSALFFLLSCCFVFLWCFDQIHAFPPLDTWSTV